VRRVYRWLCENSGLIALAVGVLLALVLSCFKREIFGG
jgi:hypothetical protein